MSTQAFSPRGKTYEMDVGATVHASVNVLGQPSNCSTYQFVNAGTKTCYIAWGPTAAATQTVAVIPTDGTPNYGIPVLSGEVVTYNLIPNAWISAITGGADTTKLYITAGEGL